MTFAAVRWSLRVRAARHLAALAVSSEHVLNVLNELIDGYSFELARG